MRIFFIIPRACFPCTDGGSIRSATLASCLARLGELTILNLDAGEMGKLGAVGAPSEFRFGFQPQWIDLPFGGKAHLHHRPHLSTLRRRFPRHPDIVLWKIRWSLRGVPARYRPKTKASEWVWNQIWRHRPDLVVTAVTELAPFAVYSPCRYRIVSTENFESALYMDQAFFDPTRRQDCIVQALDFRHIEREVFPAASQVWFTSKDDEDLHLRAAESPINAWVVPNVAPPSSFLDPESPGDPGSGLFIGSLHWPPNQGAVRELIKLSAALESKGVSHRIRVIGSGAPASLQKEMEACPGIVPMGFVEDLTHWLKQSGVVIIPMVYGGGTKLKTLEAMASGKPMLLSPMAAKGIDGLQDGVHAVIRPLGASFIQAAAEMIAMPDRYQEIGRNARQLALASYSLEAMNTHIDKALAGLGIQIPGNGSRGEVWA